MRTFSDEHIRVIEEIEHRNFWYRIRKLLVVRLVGRHRSPGAPGRYLEIGCGTGGMLEAIRQRFPELQVAGSDILASGLRIAGRRVGPRLFQADACRLPHRNGSLAVVGAYDLIEHVEQDRALAGEVLRVLEPGGLFVVTVPAQRWLWSHFDTDNGHRRRYQRRELAELMTAAGFETLLLNHFFMITLPGLAWLRLRGAKAVDPMEREASVMRREGNLNPVFNRLAYLAARLELALIERLPLPIGSSLVGVFRRPA